MPLFRLMCFAPAVLAVVFTMIATNGSCANNERLAEVRARVEPGLRRDLAAAGLKWGAPVLIRAFKESAELELWMAAGKGEPWRLWRTWPIARQSGALGPKQREGDLQVPEGFYQVSLEGLNPLSRYHLSFNIGYPNERDRHLERTGSLIMIHGGALSIGCLAMTDPVIGEIYLLVEAALRGGQAEVPVHLFPFWMTKERLEDAADSPWLEFWTDELLPVWNEFEKSRIPPRIIQSEGRYLMPSST
jgi:murein L,D-transpeptidase YafK